MRDGEGLTAQRALPLSTWTAAAAQLLPHRERPNSASFTGLEVHLNEAAEQRNKYFGMGKLPFAGATRSRWRCANTARNPGPNTPAGAFPLPERRFRVAARLSYVTASRSRRLVLTVQGRGPGRGFRERAALAHCCLPVSVVRGAMAGPAWMSKVSRRRGGGASGQRRGGKQGAPLHGRPRPVACVRPACAAPRRRLRGGRGVKVGSAGRMARRPRLGSAVAAVPPAGLRRARFRARGASCRCARPRNPRLEGHEAPCASQGRPSLRDGPFVGEKPATRSGGRPGSRGRPEGFCRSRLLVAPRNPGVRGRGSSRSRGSVRGTQGSVPRAQSRAAGSAAKVSRQTVGAGKHRRSGLFLLKNGPWKSTMSSWCSLKFDASFLLRFEFKERSRYTVI